MRSAPLVSRTLAQIYHEITPSPSPVLARALLTHAGRLEASGGEEGRAHDEDQLAYLRDERDYFNGILRADGSPKLLGRLLEKGGIAAVRALYRLGRPMPDVVRHGADVECTAVALESIQIVMWLKMTAEPGEADLACVAGLY